MMQTLLATAGMMGLIAVGFGAFGAHALEGQLSDKAMGWWGTAGHYLLPHAVAVIVAARTDGMKQAGWLWAIGSLIFAGTLYAMALGAPSWFGAITPVGGALMLTGWATIFVAGLREKLR